MAGEERYRFLINFLLKSNDFDCPGWPGAAGMEKYRFSIKFLRFPCPEWVLCSVGLPLMRVVCLISVGCVLFGGGLEEGSQVDICGRVPFEHVLEEGN